MDVKYANIYVCEYHYSLPRNEKEATHWIRAIEAATKQNNLNSRTKHSVVCSLHFTKDSFINFYAKSRRLKAAAIPSIFPNL